MAQNPTARLTATLYDQSSELASFTANRPAVDSLTAGIPAVMTDFITDIAPYVAFDEADLKAIKANATRRVTNDLLGIGNREDKWLLQFQDTVTLAPYNVEIPCRAGGIDTVPGTDYLPEADVALFRASAQSLFYSPDGNIGNLLYVVLVGRRS